jgi:hypothetical protein
MRLSARHLAPIALILCIGSAAFAKDDKPFSATPPQAYRDLVGCRAVAEPQARLACYDRQVAQIEQATAAGDVVIADRAAVRQARMGLFGFRLPSLNIFGGGDDRDEPNELETTITSVSHLGYGALRLTLADGAVWEQTDSETLGLAPKSGSRIRIRPGALGAYRANIDGQPAIKVRRVQ